MSNMLTQIGPAEIATWKDSRAGAPMVTVEVNVQLEKQGSVRIHVKHLIEPKFHVSMLARRSKFTNPAIDEAVLSAVPIKSFFLLAPGRLETVAQKLHEARAPKWKRDNYLLRRRKWRG
jgi:hypothetical protein